MKLLVKKDVTKVVGIRPPVMDGDVGYDLFLADDTDIPSRTAHPISIPTEISLKLPEGHWGLIVTRSSSNKKGLLVLPGIIDCGYVGPIFVLVYNQTQITIKMKKHERVAQFIILPIITPPIEIVTELPETTRGVKGFGSTGA